MGAGGGLAASRLAAAGLRVVGLEAGGRYEPSDFALDEVTHLSRNEMGEAKANHEVPTVRRSVGEEATRPPFTRANLMMNGVGGSKIHSTNKCFRLRPYNFRTRRHILETAGADAIPAGSTLADWPLGYDEIEPYYDEVEKIYGVSGTAGNLEGRTLAGGNPYEGPRRSAYPLAALRQTGWTRLLKGAAEELGWHPFPTPASIRSQAYDGMPGCEYCSYCTWNGCWAGAKGVPSQRLIPEAEASGNLEVRTGARVLRIEVDKRGRACGVTYAGEGGTFMQPARLVVLSAFTYENTRLLLLSRSDRFPAGLANNGGQVGRHFMTHTFLFSFGTFPGRRLNGWWGTGAQAVSVADFDGGNEDPGELGFIGGSVLLAPMGNVILPMLDAVPPGVPLWGSAWKAWVAENLASVGWAYALLDPLPYEDHFLDLDPVVRDRDGVPVVRCTYGPRENETRQAAYLTRRLEQWMRQAGAEECWGLPSTDPQPISTHAYGGTRMGEDPVGSVVDAYCMAHEVPNLAVVGASCFPTAGGVNPTETVEALALRTSDHIAGSWSELTG